MVLAFESCARSLQFSSNALANLLVLLRKSCKTLFGQAAPYEVPRQPPRLPFGLPLASLGIPLASLWIPGAFCLAPNGVPEVPKCSAGASKCSQKGSECVPKEFQNAFKEYPKASRAPKVVVSTLVNVFPTVWGLALG